MFGRCFQPSLPTWPNQLAANVATYWANQGVTRGGGLFSDESARQRRRILLVRGGGFI